jgi:hypothetical protein
MGLHHMHLQFFKGYQFIKATFEIEWVGYDSGSDYKLSLTNCCDSLAEAQDSDCARGKFIFLKRVEHV